MAEKYLSEAVQKYGPLIPGFKFAGVILVSDGPPKVSFPTPGEILIHLTESVVNYEPQAIFQLAHEVVHVISPAGQAITNNLEEGVATYNSKLMTDRDSDDLTYTDRGIKGTKYAEPLNKVQELLNIDPEAIKKIRELQPKLLKVTPEDFKNAGLNVPQKLVEYLLKPMEY